MKILGRWLLVGTFAVGGLGGTAFARAAGDEGYGHKTLTMDQLPAAVRATFQREASGGQIKDLHSKERGGKTLYEGEVVTNGKVSELKVSPDGSLLERERQEHDDER